MTQQNPDSATILVVDDDKDNVRILETYLKSEGYRTDRAYSGSEALEKVYEQDFDLILLDVMLPDTSGYQICEKIKTTPEHADIPITMVTALDKIDDKLKSLNLGAEDFLSKPIDETELLLKVKRQISHKLTLERNRREKQELKALSNILSINYYEKTLEEILKIITVETSYLLDSDRTTIFLKNGNKLISKNAEGLGSKPLIIPIDKGICGYVATNGEAYVVNDTTQEPMFNPEVDKKTGYVTKRIITFPIFHQDKVIGVIQSLNKRKDYNSYDLELIKRIADHTSNVLIRFYAEKKLMESERLHRNLMERQSNAIFTVDNSDRINFSNQAFTKLTGYQTEEILNKDIKILFIPSDLDTLYDLDEAKEVETTLISKSFEMLQVAVTITRYEADNRQTGRIFSVIDLRDRKELEKQQMEIERMRQDFNSMIVHDLKNPLSIIMGFSELILNDASNLNQKQKDFVEKIMTSSEDLLKLTNEILEVSKYEAGKMPLQIEQVDMNELVDEVLNSQSLAIRGKQIDLLNEKIELVTPVEADAEKIKRLFTNLLSNAIKFTPKNGQIRLKYRFLDISGVDYLEIKVSDTGVGIPEDDLPRIFDKYRQTKASTAHTDDMGTGLGLSICKMITESHQGKIEVNSQVNVCTTFTVTLPFKHNDPT